MVYIKMNTKAIIIGGVHIDSDYAEEFYKVVKLLEGLGAVRISSFDQIQEGDYILKVPPRVRGIEITGSGDMKLGALKDLSIYRVQIYGSQQHSNGDPYVPPGFDFNKTEVVYFSTGFEPPYGYVLNLETRTLNEIKFPTYDCIERRELTDLVYKVSIGDFSKSLNKLSAPV